MPALGPWALPAQPLAFIPVPQQPAAGPLQPPLQDVHFGGCLCFGVGFGQAMRGLPSMG